MDGGCFHVSCRTQSLKQPAGLGVTLPLSKCAGRVSAVDGFASPSECGRANPRLLALSLHKRQSPAAAPEKHQELPPARALRPLAVRALLIASGLCGGTVPPAPTRQGMDAPSPAGEPCGAAAPGSSGQSSWGLSPWIGTLVEETSRDCPWTRVYLLGWGDPHPVLVRDPLGTSQREIPPYIGEPGALRVICPRGCSSALSDRCAGQFPTDSAPLGDRVSRSAGKTGLH